MAAASAAASDGGDMRHASSLVEEQPHCSSDDSKKQQQQQKPLGTAAFLALFAVCTLTYSAYTLLLHLCDTDSNGSYLWLTGSMVMLTELAKLGLSLTLLAGQTYCRLGEQPDLANKTPTPTPTTTKLLSQLRPSELLAYGVPALLYAVNNNLGALLQLYMDPVSFQILSNLKIITTALLFRAIMRQHISRVQWLALLVLFIAGVSNSVGGLSTDKSSSSSSISKGTSFSTLHVTPLGLALLLVYCTISGLAGVYTEYVLKRQASLSVHLQNSLLYVYGIAINLAVFAAQLALYRRDSWNPLRGFSALTWILVASQAIGGICMGMLMKFASNIAKLFVVSTAMLLITLASVLFFDFAVNAYCAIAFVCVVAAQYLYYNGCPGGYK